VVKPNPKITENEKYNKVVFGQLTPGQERYLGMLLLPFWALAWAAIALHTYEYIPTWALCLLVFYANVKHTVAAHDCWHLRNPLPFQYRMGGSAMFCGGFMPFACTFGDVEHQHVRTHHKHTKGVADHNDLDNDSIWSSYPLPLMLIGMFISPSHMSAYEIIFYQYAKNPSFLWPERIAANILHWAQLYVLYQTPSFWPALMAGHVAQWFLWVIFHGLLHRPSFLKFLLDVDPSGLRQVPILDTIFYVISANAWLEIKWHDMHHTHVKAVQTYGAAMARGYTYDQIQRACADACDDGLLIDEKGVVASPLAEVGHVPGSRKAYLAKKAN